MRRLMDWLFARRKIADLEARVQALLAEKSLAEVHERRMRLLIAVLRDCNRDLDERLNAVERN